VGLRFVSETPPEEELGDDCRKVRPDDAHLRETKYGIVLRCLHQWLPARGRAAVRCQGLQGHDSPVPFAWKGFHESVDQVCTQPPGTGTSCAAHAVRFISGSSMEQHKLVKSAAPYQGTGPENINLRKKT
jgi:hypothetical protein